jgi:hypothetical protein
MVFTLELSIRAITWSDSTNIVLGRESLTVTLRVVHHRVVASLSAVIFLPWLRVSWFFSDS